MAILADGVTPTQLLAIDNNYKALRASARPVEHGAGGQYRLAAQVQLIATQAANGTLFSFRWGSSTLLAVIQHLRLTVQQTGAATATIWPNFQIFQARSFTVSDSVGTALTITGNSFKTRTSMATTAVTDIRVASAAAGLTVGTRTLDGDPILSMPAPQLITGIPVAAATTQLTPITQEVDMRGGLAHPLVLAQNEGFIVRGPSVIFGAAGTANLLVEVAWAEVPSY